MGRGKSSARVLAGRSVAEAGERPPRPRHLQGGRQDVSALLRHGRVRHCHRSTGVSTFGPQGHRSLQCGDCRRVKPAPPPTEPGRVAPVPKIGPRGFPRCTRRADAHDPGSTPWHGLRPCRGGRGGSVENAADETRLATFPKGHKPWRPSPTASTETCPS